MRNAAPLPPRLELPEPFAFARKLHDLDPAILSVRHLNEPEYAAFAVVTVVSREVVADLEECVRYVYPFLPTFLRSSPAASFPG